MSARDMFSVGFRVSALARSTASSACFTVCLASSRFAVCFFKFSCKSCKSFWYFSTFCLSSTVRLELCPCAREVLPGKSARPTSFNCHQPTLFVFCRLLKSHSKVEHALESFLDCFRVLSAVVGRLSEIIHATTKLYPSTFWIVEKTNDAPNL